MCPPKSAFLGGNTTKAGIPNQGLDRDRIDEIIFQASKGSRYYQHQQRREEKVRTRVANLRAKMENLLGKSDIQAAAEKRVQQWVCECELHRRLERTFVHVDMDAFFAAVEARDNPELANIPMAVGSDSMLSTSNYAARQFGVVSAMPGFIAKRLCPQLVIVPHSFAKYKLASNLVRTVLSQYDPNFASFSLDEACLDLTEHLAKTGAEAEKVVEEMRRQIFEATQLTCSAGIASNRKLAKMCSNINKPNGQFRLQSDRQEILDFVQQQPIKRISGIGKVMAKVLEDLLAVKTCRNLWDQRVMVNLLFSTNQFEFLIGSAMGLGSTIINPKSLRKSMSVERTFKPITSLSDMKAVLNDLSSELAQDLAGAGLAGITVGIKLKTAEFDVITRAVTLKAPIYSAKDICRHATLILAKNKPANLRLLGVKLAGLEEAQSDYERLDRFVSKEPHFANVAADGGYTCPVCTRPIGDPDNHKVINDHVDQCLSKQYLSNMPIEVGPGKPSDMANYRPIVLTNTH